MSNTGNRYAQDIRRIVGIDPNESELASPEKKAAIPSKRGIGYVDPRSGSTQGVSGRAGNTALSSQNTTGGTSTGANNTATGGFSANDPYAGFTQGATGTSDAAGIIDGTAPESRLADFTLNENGVLEYNAQSALNTFTAENCDTGNALNVQINNGTPPPQAVYSDDGTILLHQAWTDVDTPPSYPQSFDPFGQTYYGYASQFTKTLTECVEGLLLATYNATFPSRAPWTLVGLSVSSTGSGQINYTATIDDNGTVGSTTDTISAYDNTIIPNAAYNDPVPTETAWPVDDGEEYVNFDGGQFTSSQYDPNQKLEQANPTSTLDFCFDSSRTGTMEATRGGGFMVYETSMGSPTGTARIYDGSGRMTAAVDATTANLTNYRPVPA